MTRKFFIEQIPENDLSPFGSELGSVESDEDGYDLREVSSDVEMHPDDLADVDSDARWVLISLLPSNRLPTQKKKKNSRFEEVKDEEPKKPQKRPRESDAADVPTKSEKKSKKLKAGDGKPVAAETDEKKESGEKEEAKEEGAKKEKKKDKKEKKKAANAQGDKPTLDKQTTAGGVIIEDFKIGTGPMAKKGNTVQMRYIGKLTDGKEFDKNIKGKPVCRCWSSSQWSSLTLFQFTFHLGKGEVIKGTIM